MPRGIHAVTVRHYDGSFRDLQEVQRYLTSVLRSEKGSTTTFCPWAESLPIPAIEATMIVFDVETPTTNTQFSISLKGIRAGARAISVPAVSFLVKEQP